MNPVWPPSIRLLSATVVLAPTTAAVVALALVLGSANTQVAENLGAEVVVSTSAHVRDEIGNYLASAVRVSDLYERRVRERGLPVKGGLRSWDRPMLDEILSFPDVASICFGNPDGEATWLSRTPQRFEFGLVDVSTGGLAREYPVEAGRIAGKSVSEYRYDPRARPWYQIALKASKPRWTPVYFWYGEQGNDSETGMGYTRTVNSAEGPLAGVLVVDVTLQALSAYLQKLPLAKTGFIFIVDEEGKLVAASSGQVTAGGKRVRLAESPTPAARAAAEVDLDAGPMALGQITIDGKAARVAITKADPFPGIDWKIIAIIPEEDFLADTWSVQRQAAFLTGAAIVVTLLLALGLSQYSARLLLRIRDHAARIGAGEFDQKLDLRAARELRDLSEQMNQMALDLKNRLDLQHSLHVAMEVQQSLLPAVTPQKPGLDVAGQSKYCDSTGGDYYDFLDVGEVSPSTILIAVGDVMGHGIAAALLMAAARAALHVQMQKSGSLGTLMSQVNRVIANDYDRHGRFMTMSLMTIDAATRSVRWASAGHDAPILYLPAEDCFNSLEGGDLPLGLVGMTEYEEYARNELPMGTILVIGTDGVWEAKDSTGAQYGKDRLREVIRAHATRSAKEIAAALEQSVRAFMGTNPADDDVTFVIAKLIDSKK